MDVYVMMSICKILSLSLSLHVCVRVFVNVTLFFVFIEFFALWHQEDSHKINLLTPWN